LVISLSIEKDNVILGEREREDNVILRERDKREKREEMRLPNSG